MREYETLLFFNPNLSDEVFNNLLDRIKEIISEGGEVISVDDNGIKNLAYEINKQFKEGHQVLIVFKGNNEILDNLKHFYRINDSIIRNSIIRR